MHFTVYSKDLCGYCTRAKTLLDTHSLPYNEIKLGRDIERDALIEAIQFYGHSNTMPMVIVEDEHGNKERVGGYEALSEYVKNNV
jgi:glutaredoxin